MSGADRDDGFEPDRHELRGAGLHRFPLPRRAFFKLLGGGVAVASVIDAAQAQESGGGRRRGGGDAPKELAAWIHIAGDGTVTAFTGKAEVGQDIRTSLTQVIVDELPASLPKVRLVMGDTASCPYDMGTFGSRTTPTMARELRRAAAAARELLLDRAATRLAAPRAELDVDDGRIVHRASGRTVAYGELTKGEKLLATVSETTAVRTAAQWRVAGQPLPKVDAASVVTGARRYTSDIVRPGMLRGKVLRPQRFGAKLTRLGDAAKVKGARVVRDGDFVGVVARDEATADRALQALRPTWDMPQDDGASAKDVFDRFRATPGPGRPEHTAGDVEAATARAAHKAQAVYTAPYIAHVPLEPRAAVAEWRRDELTVWTGTQRPFGVRRELAEAFHVAEEKVRVIASDTGSGYGGKHTGEAAIEAARLARAAGKPVKVVWTREEEMTWAYFRPAAVVDVRGAIDAQGALVAWEMHDYNAGTAALRTPYAVPNQRHVFHPVTSPLRQGSYRALAATANNFAREVMMDELAAAARLDPLAFRRKNLRDERLLGVLAAAAERFGWGARPPAGVGHGIACGADKGGWVANCVEVRVDERRPRVVRVVTAFDCGPAINPDGLKNQIEGAVIMGLGGALFEAIDFAAGRVLNPRLSEYRVPRFGDVPALETVIVADPARPSGGAGETPIIAVAPAIANALFMATGRRWRAMPFRPA